MAQFKLEQLFYRVILLREGVKIGKNSIIGAGMIIKKIPQKFNN